MLFSPIEDAPQEHYSFVVRSSQDHQYSFIRTPRTNVPEAALRGQIYSGTGIYYQTCDSVFTVKLPNKPEIELEMQEIASYSWYSITDITLSDIAFPSIKMALANFIKAQS